MKGLVTRNIHVKYEIPISHGSQFMTKVKVFEKYVKLPRSRSLGQNLWNDMKGLVTRNTYKKYESPVSHDS